MPPTAAASSISRWAGARPWSAMAGRRSPRRSPPRPPAAPISPMSTGLRWPWPRGSCGWARRWGRPCPPPVRGFLKGRRALADRPGALLLFDEVVPGFRLAYGGAQEFYGVLPDLVAYGKALGGGLPIGAFGGRADIMAVVREDRLGR